MKRAKQRTYRQRFDTITYIQRLYAGATITPPLVNWHNLLKLHMEAAHEARQA